MKIYEKIFDFEVGRRVIDIVAETEKEAIIKLCKMFWSHIDYTGEIKLLGEMKK